MEFSIPEQALGMIGYFINVVAIFQANVETSSLHGSA